MRWLTFFGAVFLLIILLPLFLFLTLLLYLYNRQNVFFIQQRTGYQGKTFHIYKFCTMIPQPTNAKELLTDKERVTSLGRFLRKTSLDELPQLFNILRGEMNFIGPRPLLPEYLPLYNDRQHIRHQVKPGITGWAQVNGRNALSWREKLEMDAWYVENRSFKLYCKILWLTLLKVFRKNDGDILIEKFQGNP